MILGQLVQHTFFIPCSTINVFPKYLRFGPCKSKLTLVAGRYVFYDKLCTKYHDYLDLTGISLMKRKHRRVIECGTVEFEKTSTFCKKLFLLAA